jgi:hypothetical protein
MGKTEKSLLLLGIKPNFSIIQAVMHSLYRAKLIQLLTVSRCTAGNKQIEKEPTVVSLNILRPW